MKIRYPFIPKSTAYMIEGQFWDIPLSNGQYACGRVLQFDMRSGKKHSRGFMAGLIDWVGDEIPTPDAISGKKLLEQGGVHILTIAFNGGTVRGYRPLELDDIRPLLELSQMPVNDCHLMRGFEDLGLANLKQRKSLDIQSTWGLGVIKILAEIYFVENRIPPRSSPWQELMEMRKSINTYFKEV